MDEKMDNQEEPSQPKKENKLISVASGVIRELLAIFFWGYTIIKLFVFDIDVFLVEKFFPNYSWLISYKFFFIIGTLAVLWLLTKNRYILLWSLFVLFYPVIVIFWKIPALLLKNKSWNLTFAFIDSIISFFKSFKRSSLLHLFFWCLWLSLLEPLKDCFCGFQ